MTLTIEPAPATPAVNAYKGKTTFTLNVLNTRTSDITSKVSIEGPSYLEAGDGEYKKYTVKGQFTNLGRFNESDLYYKWDVVTAALMDKFDLAAEKAKKGEIKYYTAGIYALADDTNGVTGNDGANIFELDGASDGDNVVKARAMSNAAANDYKILVRVYGSKAEADKSEYNMISTVKGAGWAVYPIEVINANVVVKLAASSIGTEGLVTLPAGAGDFENVVTAKSVAGTDLTDTATYYVKRYDTYMKNLNEYGSKAWAIKLLGTGNEEGLSVNKGKLTVTKKAEAGAYVVVAVHPELKTTGISEDFFLVKTADGVDVTGLEVDQNDVVLDNKNNSTLVYAKVLPTSYYSNGYSKNTEESAQISAVTVSSDNEDVVRAYLTGNEKPVATTYDRTYDNTTEIRLTAKGKGEAYVTVKTVDGGYTQTIKVTVRDSVSPEVEPEPTPEHKAGDAFTVDGVSVFVNADGKTLTVTDVAVVGKTATIPATVDGMDVTAIAAQAFKKSDAKTIYVKAAVTDIEKGAFKKAKTKKIFFYEPAALETVAKNAFKGANVKVVGVGGSFSESAASQLKKAGAKSVKNNGTAK